MNLLRRGNLVLEFRNHPQSPFDKFQAFRGITTILIAVNNSLTATLPEERGVELLRKCHQSFLPAVRKHLIRLGVKPDGGPQHGYVRAKRKLIRKENFL